VSSPQRGKNSKAEKIGRRSVEKTGRGRDTAKRKEMPEGSSSLSKGRPHRHHRIIIVQKLGKNFLAGFISSFQQGDESYRSFTSDQEATCLLVTQENSRGLSTMQGVGKRNENVGC